MFHCCKQSWVSDIEYTAKTIYNWGYFLSVSCAWALRTVGTGDILSSDNSNPVALEIMSFGSFGKVAKRLSLETKKKDGGCEDESGPHLYRPGWGTGTVPEVPSLHTDIHDILLLPVTLISESTEFSESSKLFSPLLLISKMDSCMNQSPVERIIC